MPEKERSPLVVALSHANMRWQAGIENASRLSHRSNGILAVIGTILGLGLFKAADMKPNGHTSVYCALMTFVVATLAFLLVALYQVLVDPLPVEGVDGGEVSTTSEEESEEDARANVYASDNLRWPRKSQLHPTALGTEEEALRIAYSRVTKAANSLDRRNLRRKVRVDRGQHFLFGAAGAAAISIVLYALLHVAEPTPGTGGPPPAPAVEPGK